MIPVGQQNEAHTLVDDCRQFFLPWWHGIDADIAGGIKDQMTVEFVSVWFRKPRPGENVGDDFSHTKYRWSQQGRCK